MNVKNKKFTSTCFVVPKGSKSCNDHLITSKVIEGKTKEFLDRGGKITKQSAGFADDPFVSPSINESYEAKLWQKIAKKKN